MSRREPDPDAPATFLEWAAFLFLFVLGGLGLWGVEMIVERWLG